ncbi:hypothetical protein DID76_04515, partial [Candidatus Marinamargulisbacteria bacterium SCGC AG-414-C22]
MSFLKIFFKVFIVLLCLLVISCTLYKKPVFEVIPSSYSNLKFSNDESLEHNFDIITNAFIYNGGGVGIHDFNNDGLLDVFLTGNFVDSKLYLNTGDFIFKDVTEQANVAAANVWTSGVTIVDINNDGLQDIYLTNTFWDDAKKRENMLFVNMGNNTDGIPVFEEQGKQYGVNDSNHSVHAVFFDYDKDNDLDLYILTNEINDFIDTEIIYSKITDGSSIDNDQLYRNNGNQTFTNVTKEAGILIEGSGLGIAVSDINRDGWPDLYISNDFDSNDILYINNKDGTFSNKITDHFKIQSFSSMGIDMNDYNNDGFIDLYTTDMLPEEHYSEKIGYFSSQFNYFRFLEKEGYQKQESRNCLHRNNGNNVFSDVSRFQNVDSTDWSWSPLFADFNNDGYKDLFVSNGFPKNVIDQDFSDFELNFFNSIKDIANSMKTIKTTNYLFQNVNGENFKNVSQSWGFTQETFSYGSAMADFDNDGDLDLIINNINDEPLLYKNTRGIKDGNYLRVNLKGSSSNLNGLGANIKLNYGDNIQFYEHNPYRGYISTVEPFIHFGVGKTKTIQNIIIEWSDGKTQELKNIKTNQVITLDYKDASQKPLKQDENTSFTIFKDVNLNNLSQHRHEETFFQDYNIQRLLQRKHSYEGPGLAVYDVDNDGLEDLYIGQSANKFKRYIYLQDQSGNFQQKSQFSEGLFFNNEDTGALFFNIHDQKPLYLMLASGGVEYSKESDFYINRGYLQGSKGIFQPNLNFLSRNKQSSSFIVAADYDKDGDLDLAVGGRLIPGEYPKPATTQILKNNNGQYNDVTQETCSGCIDLGLATAALWTDYNNDSWVD